MEFCVQHGLLGGTSFSSVKLLVYLYAKGLTVTIVVCRPCWAVGHCHSFINSSFIDTLCICNIRRFQELNFSW